MRSPARAAARPCGSLCGCPPRGAVPAPHLRPEVSPHDLLHLPSPPARPSPKSRTRPRPPRPRVAENLLWERHGGPQHQRGDLIPAGIATIAALRESPQGIPVMHCDDLTDRTPVQNAPLFGDSAKVRQGRATRRSELVQPQGAVEVSASAPTSPHYQLLGFLILVRNSIIIPQAIQPTVHANSRGRSENPVAKCCMWPGSGSDIE